MIDENKVKLMTKCAIFEKNEVNDGLRMSRYYRRDYVRFNVLKTWVAITIVFWLIVGAYVFMSFEDLLANINDMDYFDVMYRMLGWYVVVCLIYFAISAGIYSYRYVKAKPKLTQYNSDLRDLIELCGGPIHRTKVVKDSAVNKASAATTAKKSEKSTPSKNVVNRTALIKQREQDAEQAKNEQIIANANRLKKQREERMNLEAKKLSEEEERRRLIQQKRRELELQRIRNNSGNSGKGDNK